MGSDMGVTRRWTCGTGATVAGAVLLLGACSSTDETARETRKAAGAAPPTTTVTAPPVPAAASPTASSSSTEQCRLDPGCLSSEHRTGDACGGELIVDPDGYLEGRHDAEDGRPYQLDGVPAPGPADEDDDDATVGPQTRYRAGYAQGWCDGGGR
jgi:hypothetical protein